MGALIDPLSTDAAVEDQKGKRKSQLATSHYTIYLSFQLPSVGKTGSHVQGAVKVYSGVPNWRHLEQSQPPEEQPTPPPVEIPAG